MCSPRGLSKRAAVLGLLLIMGTACSAISRGATAPPSGETSLSQAQPSSIQRDADVPDLPFPDNPDPNACGIPTPTPAYTGWVSGVYQGQVIEPTVFLYDSHERGAAEGLGASAVHSSQSPI